LFGYATHFFLYFSEIKQQKTKLIADYKEMEGRMTVMASFIKRQMDLFFEKTVAQAVEDGKYAKEGK
jgi:hypothetical protein